MSLALSKASHALIGHMEADDERPPHAFSQLAAALAENATWHGAVGLATCVGWDRPGMRRYVEWQNQLATPEQMRAARFVEIPSLHQAGLFRREAVDQAVEGGEFRDDLRWAVDLHFWLNWFEKGLVVGRVPQILYKWRQHPGQQTRQHGRLSIANMRRCKIDFLTAPNAPLSPAHPAHVQVWSCGSTLRDWVEDLRTCEHPPANIEGVNWKPGTPLPRNCMSRSDLSSKCSQYNRLVRVFAYGMEKPRLKARATFPDWDDELDVFVA